MSYTDNCDGNDDNDDIHSILEKFSFFNSNYIDDIIEKTLVDLFITEKISINDKKMIQVLIKMQKKNKFKELKLIFMTSLTFSIKKIINHSQSENKNDNNILNYAILKLVTLFISNSLGNFLSDKFHKEEDVVINDIISLSSANFNNTTGVGTISNWMFTPNVTLKNVDKFTDIDIFKP